MTKSKPSLRKRIDFYLSNKPYHFHSPVHSGALNPRDLSELTGLDSLNEAAGILKEIQDFIAGVFGARSSYLLVNGASLGNQTAVLALKQYLCHRKIKKPILISPNSHKSLIAALILFDLDFDFLERNEDLENLDIKYLEKKYSALFLTNPSYEGIYFKIPKLSIPVLVDEAHGAHYYFTDLLPEGALRSGADIAVQSWHKCLGSLGQTGVLHLSKESPISPEFIKQSLGLLQTSSPSYLLLESLSDTALWVERDAKKIFTEHISRSRDLGFEYFNDPSRAIFRFNSLDDKPIPGPIIEDLMETRFNIALEASFYEYALAFISYRVGDLEIEKLKSANDELKKYFLSKKLEDIFRENSLNYFEYESLKITKNLKRYRISNSHKAFLEKSEMLLAPCPPGIPLRVPGFKLTEDIITAIKWREIFYPESINPWKKEDSLS